MLSVSVVVATYNRPEALARTLDALRAVDYPADLVELIVVDSGATGTGVPALVRARDARYERHTDAGVAAARNHGARQARGEVLLFVDDDIVVGPANVAAHAAIHDGHERCLVSGHWEFDRDLRASLERTPLGRYRLAYEDRYNRPDGASEPAARGRVHPRTLAAGNLSVRREVFWSLDGFDERFPVAAEDQDLTWRARRAGCTLVYDYDIGVIHNDQHRDLSALCRRQERAAVGVAYFIAKNPDVPAVAMLALNGPVRRGDSARLIARKLSRAALSRPLPVSLAHRLVAGVERVRPDGGWPLELLYDALGGLYVFRGVRRGLRLTAGSTWASGHEPEAQG